MEKRKEKEISGWVARWLGYRLDGKCMRQKGFEGRPDQ